MSMLYVSHLRFCSIFFFASLALTLRAQNNDDSFWHFSVEAGYSPVWIIGNHPAKYPIFSQSDSHFALVTGSNLHGIQHGWDARFNIELGTTRSFIIPMGIQTTYFKGVDYIGDYPSHSPFQLGTGTVTTTTTSLQSGILYNRNLVLPGTESLSLDIFGGATILYTTIQGAHFNYIVVEKATGKTIEDLSIDTTLKSTVWRFGTGLKAGCALRYQHFGVVLSAAYEVLNLIGRDTEETATPRGGELLTPTYIGERNEHILTTLTMQLALQYHF